MTPITSSAVTNLTDCHTAQFRLRPDPTQTDCVVYLVGCWTGGRGQNLHKSGLATTFGISEYYPTHSLFITFDQPIAQAVSERILRTLGRRAFHARAFNRLDSACALVHFRRFGVAITRSGHIAIVRGCLH